MPKVGTKRAKTKKTKTTAASRVAEEVAAPSSSIPAPAVPVEESPESEIAAPEAAAPPEVETPAAFPDVADESPAAEEIGEDRTERPGRPGRDRMAASLNIAKLQAMSMTELNQMAKDLGIENFGTMRKHEVIFHILQKNAERVGGHVLRRRPGGPARRLRFPPLPELQLPALPGGHLRFPFPDPALRSPDRQPDCRPDPSAQGEGAVLRPAQGRGGGRGGSGEGPGQDPFRQPDPAVPRSAVSAGDRRRGIVARGCWTWSARSARAHAD